MSTPAENTDFTDWKQVVTLLQQAESEGKIALLLKLLLTVDEKEALLARVNIFHELLNGQNSQRKISENLGVGVATITRGSNELKLHDEITKVWLSNLLQKAQDS